MSKRGRVALAVTFLVAVILWAAALALPESKPSRDELCLDAAIARDAENYHYCEPEGRP